MPQQMRIDYQLSKGSGARGERIRGMTFEALIEGLANGTPLYVRTSGFPKVQVDPIEVNHFNEKLKMAGKPSFQDISIVIDDVVDPATAREIYDWWTLVYDQDQGIIGYASEYKRNGTLIRYDTKGDMQAEWKITGVFPTNIDFGEGDYTNADAVQINVTLSVDRAYML